MAKLRRISTHSRQRRYLQREIKRLRGQLPNLTTRLVRKVRARLHTLKKELKKLNRASLHLMKKEKLKQLTEDYAAGLVSWREITTLLGLNRLKV